MSKVQITELNAEKYFLSVNRDRQKQIKGGLNQELLNLLEGNKQNIWAFSGEIGNTFFLNLIVDSGSGNQIYQSPS